MYVKEVFFGEFMSERQVPHETVESIWHLIETTYQGPTRFFHNLRHIENLLKAAEAHERSISDVSIFRLAVILHDLFYVPGNPANEANSALYFDLFGPALSLTASEISYGKGLVIATLHPTNVADEDQKLISDLDLASLAPPWDQFIANTRLIQQEVVAAGGSITDFRRGSDAFWSRMLNFGPLYQTETCRRLQEQSAQANIKRLLEVLRSGADI